ncbi:MAG: hypothetical protein IKA22_12695 [Lentisphaeria bacterium]|nr:hypothetical protein [Lentisphaeria bacterium]
MKNSLTNPVKYGKIIAVEAILLTIGIHLLFFWIFSVPADRQERTESGNTTVTMLRLYADNTSEQLIKEHISKYAPTHFSSGNSPFSFSRFVNQEKRNFVRMADLSSKDTSVFYENNKIEYGSLPDMTPVKSVLPRRETGKIQNSVRKIDYPFAVSDSGLVLPLTLSVDELRMANEFPLNCGVFKLFNPQQGSSLPRLVLLQSCGRHALDRLSIKLLYQEIKKLSECADGEILTVHYREHDSVGGAL